MEKTTSTPLEEKIQLPTELSVEYASGVLTIRKGSASTTKKLSHPLIMFAVNNNTITIATKNQKRNYKKILYTYRAHINNMIKGLNENFVYHLKLCAGHFPITIKVDKNKFIISNFLGEKVPRTANILSEATVKIDKEMITVTSSNKEAAGQTAANIERATFIRGRDRRLFQDGIYIVEKPHARYI